MRGVFAVVQGEREPTPGQRLVAFGVRWAILSVAVWVAANMVGGIHLDGWESTLLVALILGLLNAFVRPACSSSRCPSRA